VCEPVPSPVEISTAVVRLGTATAAPEDAGVPPSAVYSYGLPQHDTRPIATTQVCRDAVLTAVAPVMPGIVRGVLYDVAVPPHGAYVLVPRHFASPALVTTHRCPSPTEKSTMPVVSPVTSLGVSDAVTPGNAPPQHLSPPVLVRPHVVAPRDSMRVKAKQHAAPQRLKFVLQVKSHASFTHAGVEFAGPAGHVVHRAPHVATAPFDTHAPPHRW
jgi:hypothetical protein